ncbi:MAG TPA: hypothetical protein VF596_22780 [Pyrinomonadaceae bacterium]
MKTEKSPLLFSVFPRFYRLSPTNKKHFSSRAKFGTRFAKSFPAKSGSTSEEREAQSIKLGHILQNSRTPSKQTRGAAASLKSRFLPKQKQIIFLPD